MTFTHRDFCKSNVRVGVQHIEYYPIHWHDCLEILVVLKGRVHLFRRFENRVLKDGDIEIINVNEVHEIKQISKDNSILVLQIDQVIANKHIENFNHYFFNCILYPELGANVKDLELFKKKIFNLARKVFKNTSAKDIDKLTKDILIYITAHFDKILQYLCDDVNADFNIPRYFRVREYVLSGFKEKIGLKQIADREHISLYHLSHECNKKFGYSFSYAVNMCRVEHSVKLLLSTNKNLFDISLECGFSAVRYFNSHFKSFYNVTPSQFRKIHKKSYDNFHSYTKFKMLENSAFLALIGK